MCAVGFERNWDRDMSEQIAENPPLNDVSDKPLVTFALFAYNQEKYIREAAKAALSQTYEPLEIILSDDCSTDRTFDVIQEVVDSYSGPHTIIINRNQHNLGLSGHINLISNRCCGNIVLVAAGDDVSMPDRTTESVNIFNKFPHIYSCSLNVLPISESGEVIKNKKKVWQSGLYSLEKYMTGYELPMLGASRAYRKEVFSYGMPKELMSEDSLLVARSLLLGGEIYHDSAIGVRYRVHGGSLSSKIDSIAMSVLIKQKRRDVAAIYKDGLISSSVYGQYIHMLRQHLKQYLVFSEMQKLPKGLCLYIKSVLFSGHVTRHQKIIYLKMIFKSLLKASPLMFILNLAVKRRS